MHWPNGSPRLAAEGESDEKAKKHDFSFPYVVDEMARAYDALCSPEFFGFNAALELQYRAGSMRRRLRSCPMPNGSCSSRCAGSPRPATDGGAASEHGLFDQVAGVAGLICPGLRSSLVRRRARPADRCGSGRLLLQLRVVLARSKAPGKFVQREKSGDCARAELRLARMLGVRRRRLRPIELVEEGQYMCHALGIAMLGYNSAEGVGAQRLPLAGEPEEVGADVGALHAVVEGEALQG